MVYRLMSDPFVEAESQRAGAVHRGSKASQELSLTNEVFDKLKAGAIDKWLSTSVGQEATREKLHQVVQVIESVRKALHEAVDNGKVEAFARHQAELYAPANVDRGAV